MFIAIHNWHGNVLHGLELDVGDSVEILEECGPWFRGTCPRKPRLVGLFPKSYIHIKDSNKDDPVVTECTQVLREWSEIWKKLYVVNLYTSLHCFCLLLISELFPGPRCVQVFVPTQSDAVAIGVPSGASRRYPNTRSNA